ncbi:hypothetical protein D3C80_1404090 [compost metagenome]
MNHDFSKNGYFRELIHNRFIAAIRKIQIIIGIGIQTNSVNTEFFNMPNAILNNEIGHKWIVLVDVWHYLIKPTITHSFFIRFCTIRVKQRNLSVIGLSIGWPTMYPIIGWRIQFQKMKRSYMIVNRIKNKLHTSLV